VESNTTDICSGWKSLFGTLKSVRFPIGDTLALTARESHWRAVLDVFEAFLATEDTQVFANAALDFVQCLNHHVRGDEEMQQLEELISLKDVEKYATGGSVDLTRASLSYLLQCHDILRRMRHMSCCPAFHGAHKINVLPAPAVVDPNVPDWGVKSWDAATDTVPDFPYSFRCLQTSDAVGDVSVLTRDAARGLYRVWYLLLDGLTSAVINCPRSYQSQAVDTLFEIFGTLQVDNESDGADLAPFGLYCTNHLLLPMLQSWLRRTQRTFQGWEAAGPNFKHCMGKATELVLRWLQLESPAESRPHLDLLLKQHLLLLTECIVVPVESVARLGCSCLR
jgi:brefeldin A-inhibited guanine nucleotide-exchange protein 3